MKTLVWVRRDFRLHDNPALFQAACKGEVVPVFIWDPHDDDEWMPGAASRVWLHHALLDFSRALKGVGSRLVIRKGRSGDVLLQIAKEYLIDKVSWNRAYEPASIKRDQAIKTRLRQEGLEVESYQGDLLVEPWKLKNKQGEPYKVYTAFWNQLIATAEIPKPLESVRSLSYKGKWPESTDVESLQLLPKIRWDKKMMSSWQVSESAALQMMEKFIDGSIADYTSHRDRPDITGTSKLSPHLHFGQISPRELWQKIPKKAVNQPFLRQIVWREFAFHLMFHFPHSTNSNLRKSFDAFPWIQNKKDLKNWQTGHTGYPIVDAGMRELWHTGWMHNRVRMIVASFLVKHLLIDWKEGAKWFWDTLVDADLANNSMGWQWVAGSGADAAPYFRIFNPITQGERFDPEGLYIQKWIPEIAKLSPPWIFRPWEAKAEILEKAGIKLGKNYPLPIIDHDFARRRALTAYDKTKDKKIS